MAVIAARFHQLRDRTIAAVDRTFAEPVLIRFASGGDLQIEAVLRTAEQQAASMAGRRSNSWQTEIAAAAAALHIDGARYPDLRVKKGDTVRALSRTGQPWFEVARMDTRSSPRHIVYLTGG